MTRYEVADWDKAVELLRTASSFGLACHIDPDGDALGSLLGAALSLERMGKKVYPSWSAPSLEVPYSYRFLPGIPLLVLPSDIPEVEAFLALDCGAGSRLGDLVTPRAEAAQVVINVDHHPGNEGFGDLNVVVPTASSTAELVYYLLEDAGAPIDRDVATCLYTGVLTDTGNFQYSNSTPETLRLAALLLEHGVAKTDVAQQVYETAPFGFLRLVGRVLGRAELVPESRFIYSIVTDEDLSATGVSLDEIDGLIDLIRSTRDADVAVLFKERPDGSFRASLRSKGRVSVGDIARRRGGGGHELAAGFTTTDIAEAVAEIAAELA